MRSLLEWVLKRLVAVGRLTVYWPDGSSSEFRGTCDGPSAAMAILKPGVVLRLLLDPVVGFGESYMDAALAPVACSLYDLVDLFAINMMSPGAAHPVMRLHEVLGRAFRRVAQFNPAGRSRRNVAHHYDLNGRLYSLFLDRDRQYSCAYFPTGEETLEVAQAAKKRHIAAKLRLDRPDLRVLDIGCGWGGMALTLAREYGAQVTGITLSTEQLEAAQARARAEGLQDRVRFQLLDYRALDQKFDRIVSVGMFEHVGVMHYRQFFDVIHRTLTQDGVALIHSIGRSDGPGFTNAWLAKYIFPGGYSPALSEVLLPIERSGLVVTDIEILRLHYAETLRHWRRRFAANRDAITTLYDERFCRMFEFYLTGAELAFRRQGHMNFQIQITREQTAVPLTRDYITHLEAARQLA
jgi:cyclopropane-fatty-acyl-phospholipid synthase